ncbi:hypothetical protein [Phenylobacterium sp.]|jgi:hypothetical protein|uniref:hypothetical protein n=1 Tax=Phenylobacterium sp. TaxID=1871053 RepID=UPI002F9541B6
MKTLFPLAAAAGLAMALAAGAVQAQAPSRETATTILCLEANGRSVPPVCTVPASRLDPREFICLCSEGGMRTVAPLCPAGVAPPPESAALQRARREAMKGGTLVGGTFQGKPMCVAPRTPTR